MIESLPLHSGEGGAVPPTLFGEGAVAELGDPASEYSALRRSAGVVLRTDLSQIRMWGRDPVRMLNGLITNDLGALAEDRAIYAAMLTPKGRMISDLRTLRLSESDILVDIPIISAASVMGHLKKFVPPMFARSEDVAGAWSVLGVYGPASAGIVRRALALEALESGEDRVTRVIYKGQAVVVVGAGIVGGLGFDLFLPESQAGSLREQLLTLGGPSGVRSVGFAALEAARIEAGRPRYGLDIGEETLPGEAYEATGLMPRAISFSKGCYTGQEVVVRIAHRGHVNRHLRGLRLGDAPPPVARTPLFTSEGKEVGWTTSSGRSEGLGESIGLGMLRREVEPGATVRLGSAEGSLVKVVDASLRVLTGRR